MNEQKDKRRVYIDRDGKKFYIKDGERIYL